MVNKYIIVGYTNKFKKGDKPKVLGFRDTKISALKLGKKFEKMPQNFSFDIFKIDN